MLNVRSVLRVHFAPLIFFLLLAFPPVVWCGQSITLAWDASTDTNVVGYVVYYGTASANYTSRLDVGANTSVTITNLQPGLTYYFATTDYDAQGNESSFSAEISYLVPGILLLSATPQPGGVISFSFPVAPSHWYEVQASPDLVTWATIWQTAVATSNDWVQFTDPQSGVMAVRFYRLSLH